MQKQSLIDAEIKSDLDSQFPFTLKVLSQSPDTNIFFIPKGFHESEKRREIVALCKKFNVTNFK